MRLWSLHPSYLDPKGLVGLWREGLLAKAVLEGKTKGYRNHPQLDRFKQHPHPKAAINAYLWAVLHEAEHRGYRFNRTKLEPNTPCALIPLTSGQLACEWRHLQAKLKTRAPARYEQQIHIVDVRPHPLLTVTPGEIENWERT